MYKNDKKNPMYVSICYDIGRFLPGVQPYILLAQ